MMASDRKCEVCREREAIWAAQFIAEDTPTFSTLGGHTRGFPVTRVCDPCKVRITEDAKASANRTVILRPGTKFKWSHNWEMWSVRPYGWRDWLRVWNTAAAVIGANDRLDKFKWYDLNGNWEASVYDGQVFEIKAVAR